MNLKAFKRLWEEDGYNLVKQDEKSVEDHRLFIYNANAPFNSLDYNRHIVLLLQVDEQTNEVIEQEILRGCNR